MSTFALWRLFHRHMFHHDDEPDAPRDHTGLLAVIAFAALLLVVRSGRLDKYRPAKTVNVEG